MPSPHSFADEEDEKTTTESGWEEEASTTAVEQGEIVDKIRAFEPAREPNPTHSRLIVTEGNDNGRVLQIVPGNHYTIGRALDNDVVLTDIAVSRKHFDLRHVVGAWVIVDRGSGNGTLVNGNIEDQPFTLANGDTIEIGNTTFRFDTDGPPRPLHKRADSLDSINGITRNRAAMPEVDDEHEHEPQPQPQDEPHEHALDVATPGAPTPSAYAERLPSSVPQPPPRPRTISSQPIAPQPSPRHHTTLPPVHGPQTLRPPALSVPQPSMSEPVQSTLPGQGPGIRPSPPPNYPYGIELQPSDYVNEPRQVFPSPGFAPGHGFGRVREPTSTAHVSPTPYLAIPAHSEPRISRRTKLLFMGTGLSVVAALVTIALIKSATVEVSPPEPELDPPKPSVSPSVSPIVSPKAKADSPKVEPPKPQLVQVDPPKANPPTPKADPPKVDPPKANPPKANPPKANPPKADPPKANPPKADPPKADSVANREPKTTKPKPTLQPKPQRVATRADTSELKAKAASLFRERKFNEASGTLRGSDVSELRNLAGAYELFGRKFAVGMAAQTPAATAWDLLKSAQSFDKDNVFRQEIDTRLAQIATKAALGFVGAKNYFKALQAVKVAEQSGTTASTRIVRDKIDEFAGELYTQAAAEFDSKPKEAKTKLQQIKGLVDAKNPWAIKATKLLGP